MPGNRYFWSLDSTGGATTQTSSELLQPRISKEEQQSGVLEFRLGPRFESEIASFKWYDFGQVNFVGVSFIMCK